MKTKLVSFFTFTLILSFLFFSDCGYNKFVPNICFNNDILPIFVSKCTTSGCHSGSKQNHSGRTNFTTYDGIISKVKPYHPLQSEVYTKCNGRNPSMPPAPYSPLTNAELATIKFWIHAGAKNSADCGGVCDTANFSYSGRIAPLLSSWCIGCHSSGNAGGGFDLSTYTGVKSSITPNNRLMGCLDQLTGYSAMPKGEGKLDACDINAIRKWINTGYPNN